MHWLRERFVWIENEMIEWWHKELKFYFLLWHLLLYEKALIFCKKKHLIPFLSPFELFRCHYEFYLNIILLLYVYSYHVYYVFILYLIFFKKVVFWLCVCLLMSFLLLSSEAKLCFKAFINFPLEIITLQIDVSTHSLSDWARLRCQHPKLLISHWWAIMSRGLHVRTRNFCQRELIW